MARIKAVLFTSKQYKDKTSPVMIRVSHRKKLKYFPMKISIPKAHWDETNNLLNVKIKEFSQLYKRKNIEIGKCQIKLMQIVNDLEALDRLYTIHDIEKKFNGGSGTVFNTYVDKVIQEFESIDKMGNASAYRCASSALIRFLDGKEISFNEIDYTLIKNFETDLISRGIKTNSISCYMRTIRAIYNRAIRDNFAKKDNSPFEYYKIKSEKTKKRALKREELIRIKNLDLTGKPTLERARDLFMFSFYCLGMSFIDIAYLKVSDICDGRLRYSRQKTSEHYNFELVLPALEIISKYSDLLKPNDYVFPIIDTDKSNVYKSYRTQMQQNNLKLKAVGEAVGISIPLSTYVARHSWATIAKRSGIPTAVISEGLGHTTERTTQIYLDSFENEVLDTANRLITL